jgi:hypothetical protein
MASERVRGQDQTPAASVNAAGAMAGTYEVTAKGGVHTSEGNFEKGDKVELSSDLARALLNEGSIKEVK